MRCILESYAIPGPPPTLHGNPSATFPIAVDYNWVNANRMATSSKVGVYVRNSDGMFWFLYIITVPGFSEAPAGLVRI